MCVLIFSATFTRNISHSSKNLAIMTNVQGASCEEMFVRFLKKLEFSRQIFEKYSNIKFHKNPSSGSRVVPRGQTDRQDEANSHFSQFCERA